MKSSLGIPFDVENVAIGSCIKKEPKDVSEDLIKKTSIDYILLILFTLQWWFWMLADCLSPHHHNHSLLFIVRVRDGYVLHSLKNDLKRKNQVYCE